MSKGRLNPDERLRDLERRAAQGDPEAERALAAAMQRIEPAPPLTKLQATKIKQLLAGKNVTMCYPDYEAVSAHMPDVDLGTMERGETRLEVWVKRRVNPAPRSARCQRGDHDFDPETAACRRKGCPATLTQTMFPMTQAEEEQAYGFSAHRAAQGFRPGDQQQGLFNPRSTRVAFGRMSKGEDPSMDVFLDGQRAGAIEAVLVPDERTRRVQSVRHKVDEYLVTFFDREDADKYFSHPEGNPRAMLAAAKAYAIEVLEQQWPTSPRANPPGVNLPEDPWRYFLQVPGVQLVPMHLIRPIRAREGGIERAGVHMRRAYDGTGERRKPITLAPAPGGGYMVCDGNSTYANAAANGWSAIPATIEPDCAAAHNPPAVDELPVDGPEKQFRQGCAVVTLEGLASLGGRMSAAQLAKETQGCSETSIRHALKDLKAFGYVRTWGSKDGFDTRAVQWEITEKGHEALRWLEQTKYWDFDFPGPPAVGPTAGIEYSPPSVEGDQFRIEAYDPAAQRVVGQIRVARDALEVEDARVFAGHAGAYSPVTLVRVHPDYRLQGVGTRLHELAAQAAERLWGSPIASPDDRTRGESAFWAKQARRGKAKLGRTRKFPSASRYFLSYPPPDSLNPPGWWERS